MTAPPGVFSAAQPMNRWEPEKDQATLRRVGKTGEEAAELAKVCFRITIQGMHGIDPSDGRTNREHLLDELADVQAQIDKTLELLQPRLEALDVFWFRVQRKRIQMDEWEALFKETDNDQPNP